MKFENSCIIAVSRQALWDYVIVVPNVAACMPGVEEVQALDDHRFTGVLSLKVGIVKLRLRGEILVEFMDPTSYMARMSVLAADPKVSGRVQARLTLQLEEIAPQETKLTVQTDLNLLGKIGEFGLGIIRKKADQTMAEFARQLAARMRGAAGLRQGS